MSGKQLKQLCLSGSGNFTSVNCLKDHCHLLKPQNLKLWILKFSGSCSQGFAAWYVLVATHMDRKNPLT